ncbi:MAG: DUF5597 domain-containing protein [Cyclobacteriaceae bacterium]|nr:DUF5597 domain-containing protein [Cyclobacteriaceae bacterium]
MRHSKKLILLLCVACFTAACNLNQQSSIAENTHHQIPHLQKQGNVTRLIVEDKPFIILGGELGNSSFTSVEYMEPVWPRLKAMNLNTVLAPVYWELIEPEKGVYNFDLLDTLIGEARKHNMKLVLLWFGSWKNSMSSHAPAWVKTNQKTYPRVKDDNGISHEILTPFSEENLQADVSAFSALMSHLKETDSHEHTVIMVQPENEIGMLPTARDYHPLANEKFYSDVPQELIQYMVAHKDELTPEFYAVWEKNGFKTNGNWETVFGKGLHTDELFMAWYFAQFTEKVTAAGKAIYQLPMFVNAALNAPGKKPGEYPSAGPLPHVMDVWIAAAPSIDFLSPDFYNPDFQHWNDLYTRRGNTLFIPEHKFDNTVAAKAAFAIGHYEAIGFSPFSIESVPDPEEEDLGKMYHLIAQLTPLIAANQGYGKIEGVLLDKENTETKFVLGNYEFTAKHSHTLAWEIAAKNEIWKPAGAIFIQTDENEFYMAGAGITATFKNLQNPSLHVGILKNEEGRFENNEWKIIRHMNGDQTHQGRHVRIFHGDYSIQRIALYNYE